MNLAESIASLSSDNADLILMRVSGSIAIKRLDEATQGKLNWIERDEVVQGALDAATEKAK
jgi:hypothetical protein